MSMVPFTPGPDLRKQLEEVKQALQAADERGDRLELELRAERRKNTSMQTGVVKLRTILSPLYQALGMVFGEVEMMGVSGSAESSAQSESTSDPRTKAVWDSWKAKLPSGEGKAIDALLLHGTMTTAQLRIHIGCASRTAQNIVVSLKSKGLIVRDGPQISLKEL